MLTFSESESSLPFHDLYLTSPRESRPLAPVLTSITGGRQAECPVRSSAPENIHCCDQPVSAVNFIRMTYSWSLYPH